ncbi:MAG: 2-oxoacid:ferredoxin oxidoreductase subunit beta [Candidatus Lokiarchaeota archaeon]|nr:2-oxoacid:ferredoxin oxidoreductase subunit beta [Candidatus Lokiarchaeota archaeon]
MEGLGTDAENTWCPGCGNFGILAATKRAILQLEEKGISKKNLIMTAGIGCSAKIFDYLNLSGVYSLHGRDMATVQGIKLANPDLKVITFSGDGNAMGEGLAHVLFAAKRNADITIVMHHNDVYALTTGQFTPLTKKGWKGPSTPKGSVETPFNALSLLLEVGATFLARSYSGNIKQLAETIVQAIEHEGFSFVEVMQPCVSWNNTWDLYNEIVKELEEEPNTLEDAFKAIRSADPLNIGVFWRKKKPIFHDQIYGDLNPVRDSLSRQKRIDLIKEILKID